MEIQALGAPCINPILDPLNDGISEVQLINWGGSAISVVNAARISHDRESDFVTVYLDADTGLQLYRTDEGKEYEYKVDQALEAGRKVEIKQVLSERDAKLTRYLLDHEHGSPFESSYWEVRVKLPIFVFRHLVRHRHLSPNEVSGRYVVLDEQFYVPTEWRVQAPKNHQSSVIDGSKTNEWHAEQTKLVNDTYQFIYDTYKTLLSNGVAREMARIVLPLGMYTEIVLRGNLRSLMHLMHLRDSVDTQEETRLIARGIYQAVRPVFKDTLEIWESVREDQLIWKRFRELTLDKETSETPLEDLYKRAIREILG